MPWFIVEVSYHHHSERPSWHANVRAKNEDEALVLAFHLAIWQEYGEGPEVDAIKPILKKSEHNFKLDDMGDIVLWRFTDKWKDEVRGFGVGKTIEGTSRHENVWINIKRRGYHKKGMAIAIDAYNNIMEKLPKKVLADLLRRLDHISQESN